VCEDAEVCRDLTSGHIRTVMELAKACQEIFIFSMALQTYFNVSKMIHD
jgi:hypothetical protein